MFIDLKNNREDKDGKSTRNLGEAIFTSELIKCFAEDQVNKENLNGSIGVITSYKSQVHCLLNELGEYASLYDDKIAEVNTVDSFQGKEKDIVIFNCVRSNQHNQIGFMKDPRRLNVAITRARHILVLVGSYKTLS